MYHNINCWKWYDIVVFLQNVKSVINSMHKHIAQFVRQDKKILEEANPFTYIYGSYVIDIMSSSFSVLHMAPPCCQIINNDYI